MIRGLSVMVGCPVRSSEVAPAAPSFERTLQLADGPGRARPSSISMARAPSRSRVRPAAIPVARFCIAYPEISSIHPDRFDVALRTLDSPPPVSLGQRAYANRCRLHAEHV